MQDNTRSIGDIIRSIDDIIRSIGNIIRSIGIKASDALYRTYYIIRSIYILKNIAGRDSQAHLSTCCLYSNYIKMIFDSKKDKR